MVASEWLRFEKFLLRHPEIGPKTLRKLAAEKRVPAVLAGRRLLIRSDALDVLAAKQAEVE